MLKNRIKIRRIVVWCLGISLFVWIGSILIINFVSAGRIFDKEFISDIPKCRVAVVLGCSKYLSNGQVNLYFQNRIDAAVELYNSGKIDCLIVSGDNHTVGYDEATDMMDSLVEAGIPEERIVCDYAGFRTLDSVVRANKVFGESKFIVISQEDHVRRAVFIARGFGIDAYGYVADDVNVRYSIMTRVREQFAKIYAVFDVVIRRNPKFLGPKESLPEIE